MRFCKVTAGVLMWVGVLIGVLWTPALADSVSSATNTAPADTEAEVLIKKRLSETRALLERGREEDAENRIAQDTRSRPQSVEWYQEQAVNFLRVAFAAHESGDTKIAHRAARLAWAQLDRVEALSKDDTEVLASIAELRGVIRERLLGTTEEAAGEYRKALVLKPDSATALEKLRQVDSASAIVISGAQK